MKGYLGCILLFMLLAWPFACHAASSPSPAPAPAKQEAAAPAVTAEAVPVSAPVEAAGGDMQLPVIRTIGGMGIVVFLMIATFFGAKRLAPRFFNKPASERNLKLLETLSMGDRRSIALVEIGNNRFLVGNTAHQINLIATLPEPVSLVSESESPSATSKGASRKEAKFRNLFEIEKNRPTHYAASGLPEDLRTKMRQLREALERS